MTERPLWVKKDAGISSEEIRDTAKKALAFAEKTNVAHTLDIINKKKKEEITKRFPLTSDDTMREAAAVRHFGEKAKDIRERAQRTIEFKRTEDVIQQQIDTLSKEIFLVNEEIIKIMQEGTTRGIFGVGDLNKASKKKIDELEEKLDDLEPKLKALLIKWRPAKPETN